jgi:hypothetical protein
MDMTRMPGMASRKIALLRNGVQKLEPERMST